MSSRALPLILTVDVGPDDAVLGAGGTPLPSWERTEAGIPVVRRVLEGLEDELALALPATWFIRADEKVRSQFGTFDAVFAKCRSALEDAFARGHEAAWLVQFAREPQARLPSLAAAHDALKARGLAIRSARAGELRHDNASMAALDALAIAFDSSALPGRVRVEDGWGIDWQETPAAPYRPSTADYRVPGEPSLALWEIPLSTLPVLAPYDASPLQRYVNPCMQARYLWPALEHALREATQLVCVLHPDEVAPRAGGGHPLIAYSPEILAENLRGIVRAAAACGRQATFVTLAAFGARFRGRAS
jgi:hypothetical protein